MTEGQHDHRAGRRVLLGGALALGLASPAFAQARPRRLGVLAPGRFSIEGVRQWTLPELARLTAFTRALAREAIRRRRGQS